MSMEIKRARRKGTKARIGLVGPSGSGKTFTALRLARGIVGAEGRILVLDTEHGSASKYADDPDVAGGFDVIEPLDFSPQVYIDALALAAREGYHAVILDSLTHAWTGKGGALELVDAAAAKAKGNSYAGWRNVTPLHNRMIDAIISAPCHVIATMRSKVAYVLETDRNGRQVPRKVGMEPVQRDGLEYEFDIVGDLDLDHNLVVSKTRCRALDEKLFHKPDGEVSRIITAWLDGAEPEEAPTVTEPKAAEPQAEPESIPTPPPAAPAPASPETAAERKQSLVTLAKRCGAPLADVAKYLAHHYQVKKFEALPEELQVEVLSDWAEKAELVKQCVHDGVRYGAVFQSALEAMPPDTRYETIHCATVGQWRAWLEEVTHA